ncbi:hypothetical protein ED811_23255 [Escherichia coli]|uniref:Uncharacterized protein n=1 Tax=Escherichia coli TaxID=562 RepID=A0A2H4TLC3_ECOLX|nr:hypothetical protein CV83915_3p0021 [Escherichia coli]MFY82310.1 hypothetical protein [Escherichia coli]
MWVNKNKYDHRRYFLDTFSDSAKMSKMGIFCALLKGRDEWMTVANIILDRKSCASSQCWNYGKCLLKQDDRQRFMAVI